MHVTACWPAARARPLSLLGSLDVPTRGSASLHTLLSTLLLLLLLVLPPPVHRCLLLLLI
jgi:hypothetical protein